jgi:hypothetical protein
LLTVLELWHDDVRRYGRGLGRPLAATDGSVSLGDEEAQSCGWEEAVRTTENVYQTASRRYTAVLEDNALIVTVMLTCDVLYWVVCMNACGDHMSTVSEHCVLHLQ